MARHTRSKNTRDWKIDISGILHKHFSSLKNYRTGRTGLDDWIAFLLLPIAVATVLLLLGFTLDGAAVSTIVSGLAIFIGLLFSALIVLIDLSQKFNKHAQAEVIKQLVANIGYTIILSLIIIIMMVVHFIAGLPSIAVCACDWIIYALITNFFATLLMILKRVFLVVDAVIDQPHDPDP